MDQIMINPMTTQNIVVSERWGSNISNNNVDDSPVRTNIRNTASNGDIFEDSHYSIFVTFLAWMGIIPLKFQWIENEKHSSIASACYRVFIISSLFSIFLYSVFLRNLNVFDPTDSEAIDFKCTQSTLIHKDKAPPCVYVYSKQCKLFTSLCVHIYIWR
jgi:hypothetical protein